MTSRLTGEETHKRSATFQVEQWLQELGISSQDSGVQFSNVLPTSPKLHNLNHSLRQGLLEPVKVTQKPRKGETFLKDQRRKSKAGNEFEGGGRTIHDNGGQITSLTSRGVVQRSRFDVLGQLKNFPSTDCHQFMRIQSLLDWASSDWKRVIETTKSNRTTGLHDLHLTLWRYLTKRLSDLYQRRPFPARCTPSPPRRASFIKNAFYHTQEFRLAVSRKILSQRGSDLMHDNRLISLQKLLRENMSTCYSQTDSKSTTPVHMYTEGNNGPRSVSPQFILEPIEAQKITATCIGFKTYRFERVGRRTRTHSIHQTQQLEKLPYVATGQERQGPILKFRSIRKVPRDDLDASFTRNSQHRNRKQSAFSSPTKPLTAKRATSQRPSILVSKGKKV